MTEEYTLPAPVAQPMIAKLVIGNMNRVSYDVVDRKWTVDLDAKLSDGSIKPIGTYYVEQDAVYDALVDVPCPPSWPDALLLFQTTVKSLAIQRAIAKMTS